MNVFIILILLLFLFLFISIEPFFFKQKLRSNKEYGSARFSTMKEIGKNFKLERVTNINKVGFPIFISKDCKKVWFDYETPHWVYLGSTGSGKSVTQVIPFCSFLSIAKIKRSAFITDPKGEIFQKTSKMFLDRDYNVLTIDFRNPEMSNKINILEPIIKEYEKYMEYESLSSSESLEEKSIKYNNIAMGSYAETNRLITSLSSMVMQDKTQSKDPFWNNSARQLLEGIIGFFLEEYKLGNIKREQITMTSIRKFQNSTMESKNFEKFKDYLETRKYGSKSKDSLTSIITASENTYKSITSVFGEKMSLFDDINVANVTSSSDFELDVLGKVPTVLYIIVPDEDKTYFTLVSIIVSLLYKELVKLANKQDSKRLPIEIDWLLDEFANCPPLADIEAIVSVARSRGMRFQFFIQSFAQLDNVYGKDVAQIILDNCGLVYLKTNTQSEAETISKRLGKTTIKSSSISMGFNNSNGSKSTSLMARDLLTADEIRQLHHKMIIFPTVGYPIIRSTHLYNKFSCYVDGMLNRNSYSLKDLKDTYFIVEDIKYNDRKKEIQKSNSQLINKEFLKEKLDFERNQFKEVENVIFEILKNRSYQIDYDESNNCTYMKITTSNLSNIEELKIRNKINKEKYYIEIEKKEKQIIILVHIK